MKTTKLTILGSLMLAVSSLAVHGATTIVSDNCTAANVNSGFALTNGVNSGINPPLTRITGSAAANLRYIQTATTAPVKATNSYTIGSNKLKVVAASGSGRMTLSANGTTPFDYASALGIGAASPTNPSVYDIKISIRNDSSGNSRCSFGLSTVEGDVTVWDFGIQLYHVTGETNYSLQKRIDTASFGGTDINSAITNYTVSSSAAIGTEIPYIIRVTDAGPETGTEYHSRVQVFQSNTNTLIYDTQNDPEISNQWRLDGGGRFISWDIAGSAAAFYDSFSVSLISAPVVSSQTWTGGGADDNWSTGDNWGGVAPSSGVGLIFNGVTRQANVNDIPGLSLTSVQLNNGGFSLSGAPWAVSTSITNLAGTNTFAGDVFWTNTVAKTWNITNGSQLVLNNTNTIEVNGDHSLNGGGTLLLKGQMNIGQATTANPPFIINEGTHLIDGGTFNTRGGYRIGSSLSGIGAQTILTNGANLNFTVAGNTLRVGDSANPVPSRLLIDNSTVALGGGNLAIPFAAGATSEVSQVGGLVSSAIVNFNHAGAGVGTYTVKNGTLEAVQIKKTTAGGNSTIYFDNAILRTASGANNSFFSGLNLAQIQSGGLTIDATSDVAISQPLSGAGNLTKTGGAAAVLKGANTYTGTTLVQSGKLLLPTIQTNPATVQVSDGAEFGVVVQAAGSTFSVPTVQFNGASFAALGFDLGTFGTPTAPLMKVGSLSINSPITINVANGSQLTVGQIVLVDYDGTIGGGFQFTLGSLPDGVSATLVNNTANSSIDLNITGVPGFRWTGAVDGNWDTSTANWIDQRTSTAAAYQDGFITSFTDAASRGSVNINGIVSPSMIVVSNNSLPYVWAGGALTVPIIKKYGTNSIVRTNWSVGDFVPTIEINAGIFGINCGDLTFTNVLTDVGVGTGTFAKYGTGTFNITSTNSNYDGGILIAAGTLKLTATSNFGTTNGATTIASGATLDVNDNIAPYEPFIVSGQGDGSGAIIDSNPGAGVDNNLTDVTLVGDTTFGSASGTRWDIRVRSGVGGPGLRGNGYNLRKVGGGTVSIACQRSLGTDTPYWQMNLGDVVVDAGSLAFAESLSLGNPNKTITINPGATLQIYDLNLTNPILRNIFMTDSRLTCGGANTDTNPVNGSISLTGACSFKPDLGALIINGPIVGAGSLAISANDPGRVYLNGANTYSGDTFVTNGLLGGTGSIAGNLIMLGGTNAPGMGIGTLTVNGNATLAGTTLMEINRSQSPNSDRLVVGGTLANGGVLKVVLATGASSPQVGDVYQLFNKAGSGTFSAISLPDLSALPGGLSWNTTNLYVNGSISVNGTVSSPTISGSSVSGGNFIMNGTGGIQGNSYTVLSSTNVGLSVANWTAVTTNVFGSGGTFSFTNSIDPNAPATFYLLRIP